MNSLAEAEVTGDEYARENIAGTIKKYHGIEVNWRVRSWQQLSDMYVRLNLVGSLRKYCGIHVHWRDYTSQQLSQMYQDAQRGIRPIFPKLNWTIICGSKPKPIIFQATT